MKKKLIILLLIIGSIAQASWWGELSGGSRAAIIGASAILLNTQYQDSELKHQRDLDRLDTEIRRDYEREAVINNAHRKYGGSGVPQRLVVPNTNNYSGRGYYNQNTVQKNTTGRVVFSDGRTQVIELQDGTRITLNQ